MYVLRINSMDKITKKQKKYNLKILPFLLDWGIPTSEWLTRRSGSLRMRPRAIGERTFSSCSNIMLSGRFTAIRRYSLCASWNTLLVNTTELLLAGPLAAVAETVAHAHPSAAPISARSSGKIRTVFHTRTHHP